MAFFYDLATIQAEVSWLPLNKLPNMRLPSFFSTRAGLAVMSFALLLVLYGAYWKLMADTLQTNYLKWVREQKMDGAVVKASTPKIYGFPFRLDMDLGDVRYERADETRITIPNLHVRARPWAPFRPTISGGYQSVFELLDRNQVFTLDEFRVRAVKPWFKATSPEDNALFVHAQLTGITLDPHLQSGLDKSIQSLSFRGRIKGSVPDFTSLDSMEGWRRGGGSIDLDKIDVTWKPLMIQAEGTFAFDKDLQPLAAFTTHLAGYMEAVGMLEDRKEIKPIAASLFRAALTLLEDKERMMEGNQKTIRVPVTVQNSMVSVAGIKVMRWGSAILPPVSHEPLAASPADLPDDEDDVTFHPIERVAPEMVPSGNLGSPATAVAPTPVETASPEAATITPPVPATPSQ
jgi:hypothetical protein